MYSVELFKDDLLKAMGEELIAMVLFGSAAIDDATKHYSDVNTLIVVKQPGAATLKTMSPLVRRWIGQGHPAPLVFSLEDLRESRDVFAIEFLDIASAHRVLHGADPFIDFKPNAAALRNQLEFEIRSKILLLQKKYFEADGRAGRLRDLIAKSFSSFTVLAKTILHLTGAVVPVKKMDVWRGMAGLLKIDLGLVETIFDIRENKKSVNGKEMDALFEKYLASIEKMAEFVDKWEAK